MKRPVILAVFLMFSLFSYGEGKDTVSLTLYFKETKNLSQMNVFDNYLIVKVKNISSKPIEVTGDDLFPYNQDDRFDSRRTIALYLKKEGDTYHKLTHFVHADLVSYSVNLLKPGEEKEFDIAFRWLAFPRKYVFLGWLNSFCNVEALVLLPFECKYFYLLHPGKYRLKVVLSGESGAKGEGYLDFTVIDPGFFKKLSMFMHYNKNCLIAVFIEFIFTLLGIFIALKILKKIFRVLKRMVNLFVN